MAGTFREYASSKYSSVLQTCEDSDVAAVSRLNFLSTGLGTSLYSDWLETQASEPYHDSTPSEEQTPEERFSLNPPTENNLRRTNPKRYDPNTDWYQYRDQVTDTPIGNRYDNPIELVSVLKERLETFDWQIEKTLEGRIALASKNSFFSMLQTRAEVQKKLHQHTISYPEFPPVVKDYIRFRFGEYSKKNSKLKERILNLVIQFSSRPADYRGSIGAEYIPETNRIQYYLPPETLNKNWDGVVHEIAHLVEDFLQGTESGVAQPPDKDNPEYYTDTSVYRQDPGEQEAFQDEASFLKFDNHAS